MQLHINLELDEIDKRIEEYEKKMKAKDYQPTLQEVWFTGYTTPTGKHKNGIYQTKLTDSDKAKLDEVYQAIISGELGVGVSDMKKFTKAHALRLYKVLQEQRKAQTIRKMIENKPENYHVINDFEAFVNMLSDLRKEEEFAIDTETTGLDYFKDKIVGISITLPKVDYHVYIPINHTEGKQLPEEYVLTKLKPILENPNQKKILFNAKFDIHMFIRHGIRMQGVWFDGLVAMKLLNENEPSYALKNLATKYGKYFGFEDKSATYEELFGTGGFQDIPIEIGAIYACKDTHLTYRFYKDFLMIHLERLPKIKKLFFDIERPIIDVCVDMEQNGFLIDLEYSSKYANELSEEIQSLEAEIKNHFGDININSPSQLAKALYDDLELPDVSKKRSTDAKTLKALAKFNKGVELLLKYRELNKLLSTYIEPLPQKIQKDGRLHGQFEQVATATGRFASRNPNLQNLPTEARRIIIAPEGWVIVGIDYSQIEPRVLAHLSGDEELQQAYIQGKDLYALMASKVFGLPMEYCVDKALDPTGTFEPRKRIKSVFLGIMYGMGAKTLSESINSTEEEAEQIIQDFFKAYPKVKAWVDETHKFAEENEYVDTMFGRKRRFIGHRRIAKRYHALCEKVRKILGYVPSNIWKEELPYELKKEFHEVAKKYMDVCRKAVNTRIQGSAADIMKLALIEVSKICKAKGWKVLATIHDEILFEVPVTITREEIEMLENAMKSVVQLAVPLKVDTAFMNKRWGDEIKKDKWFSQVA
jgi:DNA polymerase I